MKQPQETPKPPASPKRPVKSQEEHKRKEHWVKGDNISEVVFVLEGKWI